MPRHYMFYIPKEDTLLFVLGICNIKNTFLTKKLQLNYLPCIKNFCLPVHFNTPVYRNVIDEESLPLVSVSKECTSLLQLRNDVHVNQKHREVREYLGYPKK